MAEWCTVRSSALSIVSALLTLSARAAGEPLQRSAGVLTGPKREPPGYEGPPLPFPDPEIKTRPRNIYAMLAYVSMA